MGEMPRGPVRWVGWALLVVFLMCVFLFCLFTLALILVVGVLGLVEVAMGYRIDTSTNPSTPTTRIKARVKRQKRKTHMRKTTSNAHPTHRTGPRGISPMSANYGERGRRESEERPSRCSTRVLVSVGPSRPAYPEFDAGPRARRGRGQRLGKHRLVEHRPLGFRHRPQPHIRSIPPVRLLRDPRVPSATHPGAGRPTHQLPHRSPLV